MERKNSTVYHMSAEGGEEPDAKSAAQDEISAADADRLCKQFMECTRCGQCSHLVLFAEHELGCERKLLASTILL